MNNRFILIQGQNLATYIGRVQIKKYHSETPITYPDIKQLFNYAPAWDRNLED